MLADFRSYARLDLSIDARLVVLTGENGAGKTNLLEALSLFSPGRGLRRAELSEFPRIGGGGGFAVSAEIETPKGAVQLGTGIEPQWDLPPQRKYRINREPAASVRAISDHLRVVWLTPAMDGLFSGPAGDRRRFLDRLVLAIDTSHGARVNAFERALRSRNRLLEDGAAADRRWLDAIEREAAELAERPQGRAAAVPTCVQMSRCGASARTGRRWSRSSTVPARTTAKESGPRQARRLPKHGVTKKSPPRRGRALRLNAGAGLILRPAPVLVVALELVGPENKVRARLHGATQHAHHHS